MSAAMLVTRLAASATILMLVGCGDDPTPASTLDAGADVSATGMDAAAKVDVPTAADVVDPCDPRRRLRDGGLIDPDPSCPLPNLIPVIDRVQIQTRSFAPGSCEVLEGCTMPGRRRELGELGLL